MGIEDRSYCYKPKTRKSKPIAFNRKPRIGQIKSSLQDLINKHGKEITGKLTIYRKGHIRYRDKNQKYIQGDVIIYLDEKGNEKIDIVWLVRNKLKRIKLLNSEKEISFKNIIGKLYRKIVIYI